MRADSRIMATSELDARGLKRLVRARAASTPPRLLAQIDQFASMARWTCLPEVRAAKGWQPPTRMGIVDGNATVFGKLRLRDGRHDSGMLIVLGEITCGSLEVASGWTLVCTGALVSRGTVVATAGDSVTYIGGTVTAKLVKSGSGAWLTLFGGKAALNATVSDYVMVDGEGPLRAAPTARSRRRT